MTFFRNLTGAEAVILLGTGENAEVS